LEKIRDYFTYRLSYILDAFCKKTKQKNKQTKKGHEEKIKHQMNIVHELNADYMRLHANVFS